MLVLTAKTSRLRSTAISQRVFRRAIRTLPLLRRLAIPCAPGNYPAYSPDVLAVGGTTLSLNGPNDLNYASETAWSYSLVDGNPQGGGGGQSPYESKPAYQDGVQSTNYRQIPDVSFDANPSTGVNIIDSYNPGAPSVPNSPAESTGEIGGTSLGAPSWAGLVAIADQSLTAQKLPLLSSNQTTATSTDNVMSLLYSLPASSPTNPSPADEDFHDITSGNIGPDDTVKAGIGYDEATGIGTPIAND